MRWILVAILALAVVTCPAINNPVRDEDIEDIYGPETGQTWAKSGIMGEDYGKEAENTGESVPPLWL